MKDIGYRYHFVITYQSLFTVICRFVGRVPSRVRNLTIFHLKIAITFGIHQAQSGYLVSKDFGSVQTLRLITEKTEDAPAGLLLIQNSFQKLEQILFHV